MGNFKTLAIVLAAAASLVWRDTAMDILLVVGIATGVCWFGKFLVPALGSVGNYFLPHGAIACVLAFLLGMIPGLPGSGELPLPPAATVAAFQAWWMANLGFAAGIAGQLAAAAAITVVLLALLSQAAINGERRRRSTVPSVAMALIRQRRFLGYYVEHEGVILAEQPTVGAIPGGPKMLPAPVPTVAAAGGVRAPLPDEWVRARIDPAHLIDEIIAALMEQPDVDFQTPSDGVIEVRKKDLPTLERIVEQVRLAAPQPSGAP